MPGPVSGPNRVKSGLSLGIAPGSDSGNGDPLSVTRTSPPSVTAIFEMKPRSLDEFEPSW